MARVFLLVMDSVGIGGAPDAKAFGDVGANTLGHIAQACADGKADIDGARSGGLHVPFLESLGFGLAAKQACGKLPAGFNPAPDIIGSYGCASEVSSGKDTISGHWEMAGLPVTFDWGYFTNKENSFPPKLIEKLIKKGNLPGILGNCHSSGTVILEKLGDEHIKTGKPICYTSADSVFQIAAHEEHFGLERLLDLCGIARKLVDPYNIGRVIARPFLGDSPANYARTANRHDYAVPPMGETVLDKVIASGGKVHAIGKISDIFAGQGVSKKYPASGHEALMCATRDAGKIAKDGDLIFTNFVDFDMLFGHRRNTPGYALELEKFDSMLRDFSQTLRPDDMVILAADHGNDPTFIGTDHTREYIPILGYSKHLKQGKNIGVRESFADIAQTIADHLGVKQQYGKSFIEYFK